MRKLLIFFTCISLAFSTTAQKVVGTYKVEDVSLSIAGVGVTYKFEKDGTFRKTISEHGSKTISGGNYLLTGDTLKLNYSRLEPPTRYVLNIVKREKLESSSDPSSSPLFADISVFNSKGEPQSGVPLVLQNKEGKPVIAFSSDSLGGFPGLYVYDKYITDLQLSYLGHKETYIKTDSLFNYQTDIEVTLRDSSQVFENEEKTEAYLINNITEKSIKIVPIEEKKERELILIRI